MWLACKSTKSPLLITNRDTLVRPVPGQPGLRGTLAVTPSEALSIGGLWLRARGSYIMHAGTVSVAKVDRLGFYSMAADELVPDRWRWIGAIDHVRDEARDEARDLQLFLLGRVSSALKTRDRERAASWLMPQADARDDAIDCVVEVAWNLMGAFDAAAKLIEIVSPTGTDLSDAKWQFSDWRNRQLRQLPAVIKTARRHLPIFNSTRAGSRTPVASIPGGPLMRSCAGWRTSPAWPPGSPASSPTDAPTSPSASRR